jgi:tRNA-Thr(GGU) m(6)t(6)A37 methyltransferase TsaA
MVEGIEPIGYVRTLRDRPQDDYWGEEESFIELTEKFSAEAFQGMEDFSHIEVVFLFHLVDASRIVTGARHPRNNTEWPAVGIFAQRGKNRPNRIGCTICRVLAVDGVRLKVAELDAIDGTPVLDIKPVMAEYLPRHELRQPAWSHEVMSQYWLRNQDRAFSEMV